MPATQCLQSLDNGEQCKAPALDGSLFCRHHDPQREMDEERKMKLRQKQAFSLPEFYNKAGIVAAITAVLHAMADRRIKRSEADTFIHGLKFAAKLITELTEAGDTSFQTLMGMASMPSYAPGASTDDIYNPTPQNLEEHMDTRQNGTPDQVGEQMAPRQEAWTRRKAEIAEPQPITRRPSNRALARLAARGNQEAVQFLAAQACSWDEQKQSSL
jgi:hypothetical protein